MAVLTDVSCRYLPLDMHMHTPTHLSASSSNMVQLAVMAGPATGG